MNIIIQTSKVLKIVYQQHIKTFARVGMLSIYHLEASSGRKESRLTLGGGQV